jgi:hypothetical protein
MNPPAPPYVWTVEAVLQMAQRRQKRERFDNLFTLSRGLHTLETQEGAAWPWERAVRDLFDPWYQRSVKFLNTGEQPREEILEDFHRKCKCVRDPLSPTRNMCAWEQAERQPIPKVAEQFSDIRLKQLALWCQEAARLGGGSFPMSCREVEERFNLSAPYRANLWLRVMVSGGILEEVEKGSHATGMATVWRYLPSLEPVAVAGMVNGE